MIEFIISQSFVLIAIVACILSYFTKNRKLIVVYRIIIPAAYAASYVVLSAYAAVYTNIINILRAVVIILYVRKNKECPLWLFLIFQALIVVVSALAWDGLITLVLIVANLLDAYTLWQKDVKIYRWVSIPVSVLFVIFNFYYKSYLAVVLEIVVLIVKIVSVIDYHNKPAEGKGEK